MKKILLPILALVLALGLVIPLAKPALAGQVYHFKGLGVDAYWSMYDEDTGVYTDISVYAVDQLYRNPPASPEVTQYAGIQIFQSSLSKTKFVPLAEVYYWGPIPAGSLIVDPKLTSGSLTAYGLEAWKSDYVGKKIKTTEVSLDINVGWTATGPLSRQNFSWHYKSPYGIFNYHGTGKSREASAQGGVAYDGVSITLEATEWASIFSAKEGYVEVTR